MSGSRESRRKPRLQPPIPQAATAPRLVSLKSSDASRSAAMMIVGGAGLLVGAVIGGGPGTIVMIGGGLVGLVGLWNYLQ